MVFSPFTLKLRELNEALKTSCGHVPGVRRVTSPLGGGGEGVLPYISSIPEPRTLKIWAAPKGMAFETFWYEIGYRLQPFYFGFGFYGNGYGFARPGLKMGNEL